MATATIPHKVSSKRHHAPHTKRSTATILSLFLFVLYIFSAATMMQNYWELSSTASSGAKSSDNRNHGPFAALTLGSGNEGGRKLSVTSPKQASTKRQTNITSATAAAAMATEPKAFTPHKNATKTKNNTTKLNTRTIPGTWKHLATLEKATNLTYVDSLVNALQNRSKVYWPGNWDGAGIVVEEYKLVLFTQGKVACTVFKQLARRMMHLKDWRKHVEPNFPHNPKHNGLTYLFHYAMPDALAILTSPEWTRAIFVRDPKERTLSAYLDKAARNDGNYVTRHCCKKDLAKNQTLGDRFATCGQRASDSFLGFLQVVKHQCCCDPHWGPQSKRVDAAFQPFINFVGHFDQAHDETRRMLTETSLRLGREEDELWNRFGASGWGPNRTDAIFSESTHAKHQTSAITKLKHYYNSTVEALVDEIYGKDYRDPMLDFRH